MNQNRETWIHFNVDMSIPNSFSDVTFSLVQALEQRGIPVPIEFKAIINEDTDYDPTLL